MSTPTPHAPVGRPADPARPDMRQDDGRRSGLELLAVVVQRWPLLVGLSIAAMLGAIVLSLVLPERYTVESRVTPESGGQTSRLPALAGQLGLDVTMFGGTDQSLDFYAELLESRELLRNVVLTEYDLPAGDGADALSGTLVQLFDVDGDSPDERVASAVALVDDLVTARPDPGANMLTLRTSAPHPRLAVAINSRILELLNEFNLERRQSNAAAERRFLEGRIHEAQAELRQAEAEMERFLSENRRYQESPQLVFEHGRLQRRLNQRQQIYSTLSQSFEQARIEEVRNIPVLTVVDPPRGPAEQTAPNYMINAALGFLAGLLLAFTIIMSQEVLRRARRDDPVGYARLQQAGRSALRPWRGSERRTQAAEAADGTGRHPSGPASAVTEERETAPRGGAL